MQLDMTEIKKMVIFETNEEKIHAYPSPRLEEIFENETSIEKLLDFLELFLSSESYGSSVTSKLMINIKDFMIHKIIIRLFLNRISNLLKEKGKI